MTRLTHGLTASNVTLVPSIHIRGVSADFLKSLKRAALEADMTLTDYVLKQLGGGVEAQSLRSHHRPQNPPEMVAPPVQKVQSCGCVVTPNGVQYCDAHAPHDVFVARSKKRGKHFTDTW